MSTVERSINIPSEHIANVFGQFDCHMKRIERHMNITMILRDDQLKLMGEENKVNEKEDLFACDTFDFDNVNRVGKPRRTYRPSDKVS